MMFLLQQMAFERKMMLLSLAEIFPIADKGHFPAATEAHIWQVPKPPQVFPLLYAIHCLYPEKQCNSLFFRRIPRLSCNTALCFCHDVPAIQPLLLGVCKTADSPRANAATASWKRKWSALSPETVGIRKGKKHFQKTTQQKRSHT